jgi:hypothetical protein
VHDVKSIVSLPGNLSSPENKGMEGEKDVEKGRAEPTVDEASWIYEQLRFSVLYSTFFGTMNESIYRHFA